jgi:two-component system response regulator GlrR
MPKKPRILCIDDLADNLRIRTMFLEAFGCETVAVQDHPSALRAVAEGNIDLLIIDYHLANGATGEEIARDVRVLYPHLPLIMLTGDSRLPQSAIDSVDAVLIKGVSNPTALLDLIQQLVPDAVLRSRHPRASEPKDS